MKKKQENLNAAMSPRTRGENASMKDAFLQHKAEDPLRHLTIQVPESLRTQIKVRAAQEGMSVRELVLEALQARFDLS